MTNTGSGNVAAAVTALGRGAVLEDTDALYATASTDELRDLAHRARAARGRDRLTATYSSMTFDLIDREQAE